MGESIMICKECGNIYHGNQTQAKSGLCKVCYILRELEDKDKKITAIVMKKKHWWSRK